MPRIVITEGDQSVCHDIVRILGEAGYEAHVAEANGAVDVVDQMAVLDGLVLDNASHEVKLDGSFLHLTLSEYRILELLLRNRGHVFSRAKIITRISNGEKWVPNRSIDVQIVSLRRKLGPWAAHLTTIRGVGYRLD